MWVGRWITSFLLLTAFLACAAAVEQTSLEDPSQHNGCGGYRHAKRARSVEETLIMPDMCHGSSDGACYVGIDEKPPCKNPPPYLSADEANMHSERQKCLCKPYFLRSHTDCECIAPKPKKGYEKVVQDLIDQIVDDPALCVAFDEAIKSVQAKNVSTATCINSTVAYLRYANQILLNPPYQDGKTRNIYNTLATFYFVLDQPTLYALQSPIEPDKAICDDTKSLTFLSQWIRDYGIAWGEYLDKKESAECVHTFKTDPYYCWNDFIVPLGGYKTFNQYFSRHFKRGLRPIACKFDPLAVVFPADSHFVDSYEITSNSRINVKGIKWSIEELLCTSAFKDRFAGGVFAHSFLNTYNYHRLHAPVSGRVLESTVIAGQFYLEVSVKDGGEPVMLQIEDNAGYQFVQQRGLVTIETKEFGLVMAMPIGMAQVSGIQLDVKPGDCVKKGDEIGTFYFGGSDFVLVFEKQANFTVAAPKLIQRFMGQLYGRANPSPKDNKPYGRLETEEETENGEDSCVET